MPATRDLARQHGVSRGTVVMAFEQLHSEGYLEGRTGDGTYVSASLPGDFLTARPIAIVNGRFSRTKPALSRLASRLPNAPGMSSVEPPRVFSPEPSPDEFPIATWAQIAARRLRRPEIHGHRRAEQHGGSARSVIGLIVGQDVRVHSGMRFRHRQP
jgi:GntR family transcriptional regulator / MocR family aminotransferase